MRLSCASLLSSQSFVRLFTECLVCVVFAVMVQQHVAIVPVAVTTLLVISRAYWGFADHFKEQADSLLNSLDSQHKKLLAGEMSKSSSNNSLTGPCKLRGFS